MVFSALGTSRTTYQDPQQVASVQQASVMLAQTESWTKRLAIQVKRLIVPNK